MKAAELRQTIRKVNHIVMTNAIFKDSTGNYKEGTYKSEEVQKLWDDYYSCMHDLLKYDPRTKQYSKIKSIIPIFLFLNYMLLQIIILFSIYYK